MLEYRCTNMEKIEYGYLIEGDFFFILAQNLANLAIEESQTLPRNFWCLAMSICFVKTYFFPLPPSIIFLKEQDSGASSYDVRSKDR